jgi:hypothetical protein
MIAASVIQLKKRLIREDKVWRRLRTGLHERFSLLAATLAILPTFGDDCDAQLAELLPRVRSLATALALDVGDAVEVEYEEGTFKGTVTGVEDALRAEGAVVQVLFDSGADAWDVDPADGGLRLVAAGRQPGRRASGTPPLAAPFHLAPACVGRSWEEALRALEEEVRALASALEHLPMWSSRGARAGRALRTLVGGVANLAAEARGWLTGVWPEARLSVGQVGEGLPGTGGRGRGAVAAEVVKVEEKKGGRVTRAEVLFLEAGGSRRVWLARAEWGSRFRAAVWPGGLGGADDCDDSEIDSDEDSGEDSGEDSDEDSDGRGGAGAKRQRRA